MWTVFAAEEVEQAGNTLPPELLTALAELRATLELSPETVGGPYNAANPGSGMRIVSVGPGNRLTVVFGVIPRDREVTLLQLTVLPALDR